MYFRKIARLILKLQNCERVRRDVRFSFIDISVPPIIFYGNEYVHV